jgi:hypothetical protein
MDPDLNISVGIFLLIPFVFMINLITGGIPFFC